MSNPDIFAQIMQKKKEQSILNDEQITIFNMVYHFNKVLLLDESISVSLPSEFVPMGKEWAAQKYPFTSRPEVIYTNVSGDINISFEMNEIDTTSEEDKNSDIDVLSILLGMRESVKKLNPANTFYNINNEANASWFDFRSYAIDGKLYNVVFAVLVDNKLVVGNFSCPFERKDNYDLFAKRIILSISENKSAGKTHED